MVNFPQNLGPSPAGLVGLTATGTNQATAFQITIQESVFSSVAAGTGAVLPTPNGAQLTIFNQGLNDLKVYPAVGDQIAGNSVNSSVTIASGASAVFSSFDSLLTAQPRTWYQQASGGGGGGGITGTGTANTLPKFTASTVVGDSNVFDQGGGGSLTLDAGGGGSLANSANNADVAVDTSGLISIENATGSAELSVATGAFRVGNPTAGVEGPGSVNAEAVLVNGVAVINGASSGTAGSVQVSDGSGAFSNAVGIVLTNDTILGIETPGADDNYNTVVGWRALKNNSTGNSNVAIGASAAEQNDTAIYNTAIGDVALWHNTSGQGNTAIGAASLYNVDGGVFNVGIGESAGNNITSGNTNIAIGYNVQVADGTANNQINIGNDITGVLGTEIKVGSMLTVGAPATGVAGAGWLNAENGVAVNGVAVTGGSGAVLSTGKIALSNAQLAALNGSPVMIISAPGANKYVLVIMSSYQNIFNSIPWVIPSNNPSLFYGATSTPADSSVNVFGQPADKIGASPNNSVNLMATTDAENAAVFLTIDVNMTAGDGTGTITVLYSILDL